jgi:UDP-N-acetylmuramoylalanine--D-glutamate ligase
VRFSELEGARVGVWGAGREVASFAAQLSRRLPAARIAVAVFDGEPPGDVGATLHSPDVRTVNGSQALAALADCDVLVRSPGVSIHRPELLALRHAGLAVTTATSLWLAERGGRGVIGVTGTKGKSTTAALAAHVARAAGYSVALAGNIGVPALDLLDEEPAQVTVLELSSFQIADLAAGPQVAVLTNLFREHADWHGSEDVYRAEKLRLLGLEGVETAVVRAEEEALAREHDGLRVLPFGADGGWQVGEEAITLRGKRMLERAQLPLAGAHNALNLCAALSALEALDVTLAPLAEALGDFRALAHRLQPVGEREGILWVDDSISTTPESALAALASFPDRPLVLIAGGQDRGQDYSQLAGELARRRASVIGVGSTAARLIAAARAAGVPQERSIEVVDLSQAVAHARSAAPLGAVVLLSPAAPSYDQHRNFEQRGERFRALATGSGSNCPREV